MTSSSFPLDFPSLLGLTHQLGSEYGLPANVASPAASALKLVSAAVDAGIVDYELPVTKEGYGAVMAWSNSIGPLPSSLLSKMGKQCPTLGPAVDGKSPFFALLKVLKNDRHSSRTQLEATLKRWSAGAPLVALGLNDPLLGGKWWKQLSSVLGLVSPKSELSAASWREVLENLQDRQVAWDAPLQELTFLQSVSLCEAMIDQGLDINQAVQFNGETIPLWAAWSRSKDPALVKMLESKGVIKDSEDLVKQQYLARFGELKKGQKELPTAFRHRLVKHLISRDDWHSTTDEIGKSAFFYAVQGEPGVIRWALEQLKSSPMAEACKKALGHRDAQGRNLWFYLLPYAKDNTFTEKLLDQLLEVVPSAATRDGRGWCLGALEDIKEAQLAWSLPGATTSLHFSSWGTNDSYINGKVYGTGWQGSVEGEPASEEQMEKILVAVLRFPKQLRYVLEKAPMDNSVVKAAQMWQMTRVEPLRYWSDNETNSYGQPLGNRVEFLEKNMANWRLNVPRDAFEKQVQEVESAIKNAADPAQKACVKKALELFKVLVKQSRLLKVLPEEPSRSPKIRL